MSNIQHRVFNDGFAIWFDGTSQSFEFDVHINEWINEKSNFIDIGLRIYNTNQISKGYIYVPFSLSNNDIVDLSHHLSSEKIARGLFNTACAINVPIDSSLIQLSYNNRTEDIIPLKLLSPQINSLDNKTLIQLSFDTVHPKLCNQETYLRFRFPHKSMNQCFVLSKHDYKIIFESPIIKDKINHTLKINEFRSLPDDIRHTLTKTTQKINKTILTVSATQEYIIDDSTCYKIRHLENDLFLDYVPSIFSCDNAIIYQWITSNKKRYNFNTKIEIQKISRESMLMYAGMIIFLSFIGNILWKLLTFIPCFNWLQ